MEQAKTRALIISYDEEENQTLEHIFKNYLAQQYTIEFCDTNNNIAQKLKAFKPDCILINANTVNETILDLISYIKAYFDFIAVLLLLNKTEKKMLNQALGNGASSYLLKQSLSAETLHLVLFDALSNTPVENKKPIKKIYRSFFPNAKQFHEILNNSIKRAKQHHYLLGLLVIEVDAIKNDTLLKEFGGYISLVLRQVDTIAFLDKKHIAVILHDVAKIFDSTTVANRIVDHICDYDKNIKTYIGISGFPLDGNSADELKLKATLALEYGKQFDNSSVQLFNNIEQSERLEQTDTALADLHKALENNELYILYQPIFDLATYEIIGIEALLRWDHPTLGSVSPADFIPFAEKSGLIIPIGNWILQQACQQCKRWLQENFHFGRLYINVSALQLRQSNFFETVATTLHKEALPANKLGLELTDIALMNNLVLAHEILMQLQALGVQISIDDFGNGFTTLTYFENLPTDLIKIDKSFINGIPGNMRDTAIISSIITLASNFGINVIAEGIETEQQLTTLQEKGCQYGQGFLLAKPMTTANLTYFLQEKNRKTVNE